jgi:hypothetical protein
LLIIHGLEYGLVKSIVLFETAIVVGKVPFIKKSVSYLQLGLGTKLYLKYSETI